MKNRVFVSLLLLLALLLGYCLPALVSGAQDGLQVDRRELWTLPIVLLKSAREETEATVSYTIVDAGESVMDRLQEFLSGEHYLMVNVADGVNVAAVGEPPVQVQAAGDGLAAAEAAQAIISYLYKLGIIQDKDFRMQSVAIELSTSYSSAQRAMMTLWEYTAQTEQGEELAVLIDAQTGKAMRITMLAYPPENSGDEIWNRWREFFLLYYNLKDVRVESYAESQCIYTFEAMDGTKIDLPLQILELTEADAGSKWQYRFNF